MNWHDLDQIDIILTAIFLLSGVLFFVLLASTDNGILILLPLLFQVGVGVVWGIRYLNSRNT